MDKVTEEVQTVKYTIRKFLDLIREIFKADVCFLYLINTEMDNYEKEGYVKERISHIKERYLERDDEVPEDIEKLNFNDAKILKFIDIVEKGKEKKWNFDYKNRPEKYAVFYKYDKNKKILQEGITAYIARTGKIVVFNDDMDISSHESSASLNYKKKISPTCQMMIGFPLINSKGDAIGVLKIENYVKGQYSYTEDDHKIKDTLEYLPLLVQLIESSEGYFRTNSYEELFRGMKLLDNLKDIEPNLLKDLLIRLIKSLESYFLNNSCKDLVRVMDLLKDLKKIESTSLDDWGIIEPNLSKELEKIESNQNNPKKFKCAEQLTTEMYELLGNLKEIKRYKGSQKEINDEIYRLLENLRKVESKILENLDSVGSQEEIRKDICDDNFSENPKSIKCPEQINKEIYDTTLHLFLVLKRNEYIGYDEILDRITAYANDISELLDLTEDMTGSFKRFLEGVRKHEELLLCGLNDYRDHFMHQFHVFVSGYIIINELGIDEVFRTKIDKSLLHILGKKRYDFVLSKSDVLRIWFLTAFYHDYAYILEKIDNELSNFFEDVLGYRFTVEFNWEQLLVKESEFPKYLNYMVKFFSSEKETNPGTLLRNYLDSIIKRHDHGVLSALLLINYNSRATQKRLNECLYAALAISLHNKTVYENLTEANKRRISFESFPIAFLLAYCDTAQSFGRLEGRDHVESSIYPVRFSGIEINNKKVKKPIESSCEIIMYSDVEKDKTMSTSISEKTKIIYKLEYICEQLHKIPRVDMLEKWAKNIHDIFNSEEYLFEIEYYKKGQEEPIYTLSFH